MARPTGWDILGLDGDPTPGVVESVQALAKEFGDFAHDVESAYRSLNSFGSDTTALQWVGQTAEAFKSHYGPLPGRLQKLYTSYSEASDALTAYAPQLLAAQNKADTALRQAQDANVDLQRATTNAGTAASDLKTAQQDHAASPNPQAVIEAQTAHDTAQTNLNNAKAAMAALTKQANDAATDRLNAAKVCARAIGHAQHDGIHNKSWWEHLGEDLSEWGGEIGKIAGELAPVLMVIALATSWIPGVDVVTAALAEADNLVALAGTAMATIGDALQGHWGDALLGVGMLGLAAIGAGGEGEALEGEAGALEGDAGALEGAASEGGEEAAGAEARTAEGNSEGTCETDPVDVVSGWMLSEETDMELPGVLPVILRRAYSSGCQTGRLFGPGWSATLDQRLSVNAAGIHFAGDDAQRLDYPVPAAGEAVLPDRGARWPLVWDRETDEIRITEPLSGRTRHFTTVHHREDLGQIRDLVAISDRHGNRIDILRDENGTPTGIEHPGYRVAVDTVATPAGPRVARLRLDDGTNDGAVVKEFRYDERGWLTGVVNFSGVPYRYEHDEAARITAWTDRLGYRYEYEYDVAGRVVRTIGTDGYMSGSFEYDSGSRVTVFRNSLGHTITYRYDENGHVCAISDPLGGTRSFENDRFGRLLSRTDPLGNTTRYVRDERGNVVRTVGPDGLEAEIQYNEHDEVVETRLPDGSVWRQEYDVNGNLVAVVNPLDEETRSAFYPNGALASRQDALGFVTEFEADAAGLTIAVVNPLGARLEAARDAWGRVVSMTDSLGATTSIGWTPEGWLTWRAIPDGAREEWAYDAEGNVTSYTDHMGGVTRYELGPFGEAVARTDANGERFAFGFDTELNLVSVTNPAGSVWSYEYDPAGRMVRETDFIQRSLTYGYDAAGQLVEKVTGSGLLSAFVRDPAGRLVARQTTDGHYAYAYDAAGRLIGATGPDGSSAEITRDLGGRIVAEAIDGRTVWSDYDRAGRRIRRRTPSGAVSTWEFDDAGQVRGLDVGIGALGFDYDLSGRETVRDFGGTARMEARYDVAGRLTRQTLWTGDDREPASAEGHPSTRLVLGREYEYLADGNPLEVRDTLRGSRRYRYDPVGRVTAVSAGTWSEAYAYDAFGNVASTTLPGDSPTSGDRETAGTLVRRAGRTSYEHDANGRVIRKIRRMLSGQRKIWTYSWNADDRLTEVTLPDGIRWRYAYDAFGRRTSKVQVTGGGSTGTTVMFTWDGNRLVEQTETSPGGGTRSLTWDYEPDTFRPAAQTTRLWAADADQALIDEVFHAIVTDIAGTPSELVTSDGAVAWYSSTTLWGEDTEHSVDGRVQCPVRFAGQYHDEETGLNYNLHRYYDPGIAAYLSPDPLGLDPAPNDHAYVPNPLTWIDPLGLACGGTGKARFEVDSNGTVTDNEHPVPTQRYNRQAHYGGAQTNSPAGQAARAAGEGEPCPVCGKQMVSGTATRPIPEHDPPLIIHYYFEGGSQMTRDERVAAAQTNINGSVCHSCQRAQGGEMAQISRTINKNLGL
ncbi:RHS repeat-associated core domain-containing protein [Catenulispora pinisilvae]|uniref:RHS repeat-associated core domain-containing protein n=1 Tax=Catenulispora pinisilvae TaxID=2705253 RepID=UPI0018924064|nr:RHS repeat-associated core domain-containing protein [Catenulispora pinisilvae]